MAHHAVYSDEQVAAALAALELNRGNVWATARNLHMPRKTLEMWRDRAAGALSKAPLDRHLAAVAKAVGKERDFVQLYADAQVAAIDHALEIAPLMPTTPDGLRALMIMAGVSADKHLNYRDGRVGTGQGAGGVITVPVQVNVTVQAADAV